MQNIPNPDVNSPVTDSNSDSRTNIESENGNDAGNDNQEIPVPPDRQPSASIEEPPDTDTTPIEEDTDEPKRIV